MLKTGESQRFENYCCILGSKQKTPLLVSKKEQHLINHLNEKDYTLAFHAIMNLYHEMLYWHIRKLVLVHEDADDVLQNTYIKIYKGLKNFKQKSSVKTWVYRIAYNESIRHLEKAGRKKMEVSDQVARGTSIYPINLIFQKRCLARRNSATMVLFV